MYVLQACMLASTRFACLHRHSLQACMLAFACFACLLQACASPNKLKNINVCFASLHPHALHADLCLSDGFLVGISVSETSAAALWCPCTRAFGVCSGAAVPQTAAFGAFLQDLSSDLALRRLGCVLEEVSQRLPQQRASPLRLHHPIAHISINAETYLHMG